MRARITISCPDAHIDDANHLAMALGLGPADADTFKRAGWEDESGSHYAAASLTAESEWVEAAQSTLQRPEWDADHAIDMDAAETAQGRMVFWTPEHGGDAPQAHPESLTAIGGMDGIDALSAMGLTQIPSDPDEL